MALTIYDRYGNPKAEIQPSDSSTQSKEIQGDNVLSLSFTHYSHIALDVDDYVDFLGERYRLAEAARPDQKSLSEWTYNLKLYGIENLIRNFLVINRVDGEDDPVFTLTAPPREHVAMIVACINEATGGGSDWKVGTVEGTDNIVVDYHGKYCDEALREIAGAVDAEWWVEGQTVNVCRCEHGDTLTLGYDNGLTDISTDKADNAKFYTRLYPVGSSRNIDREKYGHTRLQLPGGVKHVEVNADRYGRVDHYEADAFADIYPCRIGTVSSVRSATRKGDDGKDFTIWYFKDAGLDFDPNDYELPSLVKRVSFQEGSELAGLGDEEDGTYYFEVNYDSKTREFEIITIWSYDDEDMQLPGGTLVPKPGDKYILWNISMPESYYRLAEQELLAAVDRYNEDHWQDISVYKGSTDHVWVEETGADIYIGRRVRLLSPQYFPGKGYRDSRITRITRKVNHPSMADIEIGDALSRSSMQRMADSVSDARHYVRTVASSLSQPSIIRWGDSTLPTDTNVFSARRVVKEFVGKTGDHTVMGHITFAGDVSVNGYTDVGDLTANFIETDNLAVYSYAEFLDLTAHGEVIAREVQFGSELRGEGFRVDAAGNTSVSGTLTVTGHTNLKDTSVFGNEYVQGNLNVGSSFTVAVDKFTVTPYGTAKAALNVESGKEMVAAEGFRSEGFVPGLDGSGAAVYKDGDWWVVCADMVDVRKKIRAREAEIQKESHVGGCLVLSPAACRVAKAEFGYYTDASGRHGCYDIYFYAEDADGNRVTNDFRTDDFVRCRTFNLAPAADGTVQNRYWWRRVLYVSADPLEMTLDGSKRKVHRVSLSLDPDCDANSDAPMAGDVCFTVGNASVTDRQNVIMIAAYGSGSPYIYQYKGINSYSLPDSKLLTRISPGGNRFTGEFRIVNADGSTSSVTEWVMSRLDAAVTAQREALRAEFRAGLDGITSTVELLGERDVAHNMMWPGLEAVKCWATDNTCTLEALEGWFLRLTPLAGLTGDVRADSRNAAWTRHIPLAKGDRVTLSFTLRRPAWLPHHTVTIPLTLFVITSPLVCGNDPKRVVVSFADGKGGMLDSVRLSVETQALGTADHSFRIHYHVQEVGMDKSVYPVESLPIEIGELCVTRGWGYGPLPWDSATAQLHSDSAQHTRRYSELKQTVDGISTRVEQQRTAIGDLDEAVGDLGADIDALGGRVAVNETRISQISQTAEGISTRVEQHRTAIGDLDEAVGDLGADINALGGRVAVNETRISQISQTAEGISTRVSRTETAITQHTSTIDSLGKRVTTNEANIKKNDTAITQTADAIRLEVSSSVATAKTEAISKARELDEAVKDAAKAYTDGSIAPVVQSVSRISQTAEEIRLSVSRTDGADNLAAHPLLKTYPDGWYKSPGIRLAGAPYADFFQIISESGSDGTAGHTFTWNHPSGTYFLRINFYAAGTWWVQDVRITEEGASANLLSNAAARYTRSFTAPGDHYENLTDRTVSLVQGRRYTIYAKSNCIPTDNHGNDRTTGYVTLWLCSAASSPQGTVNSIVSAADMATGPWRGYVELWGRGSSMWERGAHIALAKDESLTVSMVVRKPSWWKYAMANPPYADGQAVDFNIVLCTFAEGETGYRGLVAKQILSFADGAEEELLTATFTTDRACRAFLRIDAIKPWDGLMSSFNLCIGRLMVTRGTGYVPFTLTPARIKEAGIDIDAGKIRLRADDVSIEDPEGNQTALFTKDGKLVTSLIEADELDVTRLDARDGLGRGATVNEDGSSGEYRIYGDPVPNPGGDPYTHPLVILGLATVNVTKRESVMAASDDGGETVDTAGVTPVLPSEDLETTETVQVFIRGFDAKGNLLWWQRCDSGERETKYVSFEYRASYVIGRCQSQTALPDNKYISHPVTETPATVWQLKVDDNTSDQQAAQLSGLYSASKSGLGAFASALLSGVYYTRETYKSWKERDSEGYLWQHTGYVYEGYVFDGGRLVQHRAYTDIVSSKRLSELPLTPMQDTEKPSL